MFTKYLTSPSFILLLAGNLYCIWYYQNNPAAFNTIIWIYWTQSVIIGLFNFIDLYTLKNDVPESEGANIETAPKLTAGNGCLAWFFLMHYGAFHFVYAIFLLVDMRIKNIDRNFLLLGAAAFMLEALLSFIKKKKIEQTSSISIGVIFFQPYLRIIPMHLMILIPRFTGLQPSMIFLVLKTIADIFSFLLYQTFYSKKNDTEVL